jgi:hypothetical protein
MCIGALCFGINSGRPSTDKIYNPTGTHSAYGCIDQSHRFCFLGDYDTDIMKHPTIPVDQIRTSLPDDDEFGTR